MNQKLYIVTAKTGDKTFLIEAYTSEADAISHVNNAIKWFTQWRLKPSNALSDTIVIWDENQNPFDNITPHITDDSIIYAYQSVTLSK